ncbi:hypothetical protein [Photobacterium sp. R1]
MTNYERYQKTCQAVFLALQDSQPAQQLWQQQHIRSEYQPFVLRGLSRLLPLRQNMYRHAIQPWLESAHSALQHTGMPVNQLLTSDAYPFPCRVNIQGNYLPCWVWGESRDLMVLSVIEPRTGQFGPPRQVPAELLVDRQRWFDAQVIDSEEDCITEGLSQLNQAGTGSGHTDEPSVMDAIRYPSQRTLNPVISVALITVVVVVFTWVVSSHLGF